MGVLINFLYEVVKAVSREVGEGGERRAGLKIDARLQRTFQPSETVKVFFVESEPIGTAAARLPAHRCVCSRRFGGAGWTFRWFALPMSLEEMKDLKLPSARWHCLLYRHQS